MVIVMVIVVVVLVKMNLDVVLIHVSDIHPVTFHCTCLLLKGDKYKMVYVIVNMDYWSICSLFVDVILFSEIMYILYVVTSSALMRDNLKHNVHVSYLHA